MIAPERFLTHSLSRSAHGAAISRILAAALDAVHPGDAVKRFVHRDGGVLHINGKPYPLSRKGRTLIIALGKASLPMTEALVEILGERLAGGIAITKHARAVFTDRRSRITVLEGGHPIPDERSLAAGQRVLSLLSGLRADDLLLCLVSGGGSALIAAPVDGVTLSDLQALTSTLLACGARIDEINLLRRHLDQLKGGGLARLAAPARVVSLILSDVIGSPLEAIASGPTAPDPSTCAEALAILHSYTDCTEHTDFHGKNQRKNPCPSVTSVESVYPWRETLKPGDPVFERVDNILIGSNLLAAQAALKQAGAEGFHPYLLRADLQGEARESAVELCRALRWAGQRGDPAPRPACIVAGGETTVTLCQDPGRGGRNTELALAAVTELANFPDVILATLATDGEDGDTDAAGAVVTGETFARAYALGLEPVDHLRRNDSYTFFAALDDLLKPGSTGTNVNDLTFLFTFLPAEYRPRRSVAGV
jgi:hydroxypyruvate reductase